MKDKKLKKDILFLITTFGVFVITAVLYYVARADLFNFKNDTAKLRQEIAAESSRRDELVAIRGSLQETVDKKERLASLFIASEQVPDFISSIEELGRGVGLTVNTKSVDVVSDQFYEAASKELLTISIHSKGSWKATMQFLALIESLPHKTSLQTFRTKISESTGDSKDESDAKGPWESDFVLEAVKNK